jgi:hypothetical protein
MKVEIKIIINDQEQTILFTEKDMLYYFPKNTPEDLKKQYVTSLLTSLDAGLIDAQLNLYLENIVDYNRKRISEGKEMEF